MEMMSPLYTVRNGIRLPMLDGNQTRVHICAAFSLPVPAKKATKQSKRSEATTPPIG